MPTRQGTHFPHDSETKNICVILNRIKDRSSEIEGVETFKKWRHEFQRSLIDTCGERVFWGPEGRAEIRANPDKYLICTDNATTMMLELWEGEHFPCNFILSKSEPFSEEMVINFDKLLHWLALYGIKEYYQIHVSGHCERKDLEDIIKACDPEVLIPIHTQHPEMFRNLVKVKKIEIPIFEGKIEV